MTPADLMLLSVASSVGLVALTWMAITIALMAWRRVHALFSALLDGVAVETR